MKRLLVTGGTVFVSKYIAKYFELKNYEVYVLNRGTKQQIENVNLICEDRNNLKGSLAKYSSYAMWKSGVKLFETLSGNAFRFR